MRKSSEHVVNERELEWEVVEGGERFQIKRKRLAKAAQAKALGCSLVEIPPGCRSWPYHFHYGNEEAIYVLEGQGDLRLAGQKIPLGEGSYVALPRGRDSAHQIHNTSRAPLRYLVISSMNEPDITAFPDSGKLGLFAGSAPGGSSAKRTLGHYVPDDVALDYWDNET